MKADENVTVIYAERTLVISIPCSSPEATHELLMRGIITCLRQHITSPDQRKDDADGMVMLTDLMQCLIPTERILLRAS